MHNRWSTFAVKLIWVVGLIVLVLLCYHWEQMLKQQVQTTYDVLPLFWFNSFAPFFIGMYTAPLFIKRWSFTLNTPLILCVTAPCLIFSFYDPMISTLTAKGVFLPSFFSADLTFWLLSINSYGIVPLVAGCTLIYGLFGVASKSKT